MVFIIIKTNKDLESELQSVHNTKEEASHNLTQLSNPLYINRIVNGSVLKVYQNNYVLRNQSLYLYQIIKIENDKKENKSPKIQPKKKN